MAGNRVLAKAQQELKMKESLAAQAKSKGMESTYSNYMEDIAELKNEIARLTEEN